MHNEQEGLELVIETREEPLPGLLGTVLFWFFPFFFLALKCGNRVDSFFF
jgi:hypothetical protein